MAPIRKRSQGFDTAPETTPSDEAKVDELLNEVVTEMFETISQTETPVFVEESIIPTDDPGARFVEAPPEPPSVEKPAPKPIAPKRHPRNIPKFSRHSKS